MQRYLLPLGFAGVEIFFVLSGFLIGSILINSLALAEPGDWRWIKTFWARRWIRTLPNYYLFLGVHRLVFGGASLGAAHLIFCQNLLKSDASGFSVSWSLAVEEWFYLLLPLFTLLSLRAGASRRNSILIASAIIFILATTLKLILFEHKTWDEGIRKVVFFRLDALMFGVLLAWIKRYRAQWFHILAGRKLNAFNLVFMSLPLLMVKMHASNNCDFPATRGNVLLFSWVDLCGAVLISWATTWKPMAPRANAVVLRLSLWSYSIYLCHLPILRIFDTVADYLPAFGLRIPFAATVVSMIAASIGTAAFVYRFFEVPILKLRPAAPRFLLASLSLRRARHSRR